MEIKKFSVCEKTEKEGRILLHSKDNQYYCFKHYQHMTRHGKIVYSMYGENEIDEYDDYIEIILRGKDGNETGRAIIDKEDYEKVSMYKWYARPNHNNIYAYAKIKGTNGSNALLHRIIMEEDDSKVFIDHINGDGLNNRKSNLRRATNQQNSFNCQARLRKNPDRIVGVRFDTARNKWLAQLQHNMKQVYIGRFLTEDEAIIARLKKEKELFGDFAPQKHLFEKYNISQ